MKRIHWVLAGWIGVNGLLLAAGSGQAQRDLPMNRIKIGLVFDVGGLGDKSFNDAAYKGLMEAERRFDVVTRTIEPADGSDRESAIRQFASQGFDLVIGVGFIFTDDMIAAARRFPGVRFVTIDHVVIPDQPPLPTNLLGIRFREQEGAFLVGALAGQVSQTHTVGFVGGMEIPLIRKFQAGYTAGVKHVCPQCRVYAAYAGSDPSAFADPTKGKELALAQYDRGADIIFHASGKTGVGVFNAARAQGKLAIGVDVDQFLEAPCCVLSSMLKGVDVAVRGSIGEVVEGRFQGGVRELGLAEGGIGYVHDDRNRRWIPEAVRDRLEKLKNDIITGALKVPVE